MALHNQAEHRRSCTDGSHAPSIYLGAHSKIPNYFLYLETGAIPLNQVILSRRVMYLQTLLKRPSTEITKQVYEVQKDKRPCKIWAPYSGHCVEKILAPKSK